MPDHPLGLALDPRAAQPLFLQIARGIAAGAASGRLRPGERLPGSRALAASLGVHRTTVLAAYEELAAQGWVTARLAAGTFVTRELPEPVGGEELVGEAPAGRMGAAGFALAPPPPPYLEAPPPPGVLAFGNGGPDARLLPVDELARAYRRSLRRFGASALDYGDPSGHPRLRAALAEMLGRARGIACGPEQVIVTRGSQQALFLAARALVRPGDAIAVEGLGYRPAWEAFRMAGARLLPLPVDAQGADVAALAELAEREPLRAVYLTPHHQYPTTVPLAAARRQRLLGLARARGFAILEDDYDHESHYEGRPVLPVASGDHGGSCVYVGTLSKVLAPGLRLGFAVAPRAVAEAMAGWRAFVDRQGDLVVEGAVAELLEDEAVQRHVRRLARVSRERRDALAGALERELGSALDFALPAGGMAIWARVDPSIDLSAWRDRALLEGVHFSTGARFAFEGPGPPGLRLGFASLTPEELEEGVRRMARGLGG